MYTGAQLGLASCPQSLGVADGRSIIGDKVYKRYTESQIRSMSREELARLKLAVSNSEILPSFRGREWAYSL